MLNYFSRLGQTASISIVNCMFMHCHYVEHDNVMHIAVVVAHVRDDCTSGTLV